MDSLQSLFIEIVQFYVYFHFLKGTIDPLDCVERGCDAERSGATRMLLDGSAWLSRASLTQQILC